MLEQNSVEFQQIYLSPTEKIPGSGLYPCRTVRPFVVREIGLLNNQITNQNLSDSIFDTIVLAGENTLPKFKSLLGDINFASVTIFTIKLIYLEAPN